MRSLTHSRQKKYTYTSDFLLSLVTPSKREGCFDSLVRFSAKGWSSLPSKKSKPVTKRQQMFLLPILYSTMLLTYSHIHLYTDKVEDLSVYKSLEKQLNEFGSKAAAAGGSGSFKEDDDSTNNDNVVASKQQLWKSIVGDGDYYPTAFSSHNQDVVQQLMIGFGFRVTAARYPSSSSSSSSSQSHEVSNDDGVVQTTTNTRSVLVTSSDPSGAKFIVTAMEDPNFSVTGSRSSSNNKQQQPDAMHHFDAQRVQDYFAAHNNRQGIAVLAFDVDDLSSILDRYMKLHPKLVADHSVYHHDDSAENDDNNNININDHQRSKTTTTTTTTQVLDV
jgi:hypothetical protein